LRGHIKAGPRRDGKEKEGKGRNERHGGEKIPPNKFLVTALAKYGVDGQSGFRRELLIISAAGANTADLLPGFGRRWRVT